MTICLICKGDKNEKIILFLTEILFGCGFSEGSITTLHCMWIGEERLTLFFASVGAPSGIDGTDAASSR